tara:strand:+ start:1622 stop:2092 length:471 start_codon:yes stop_codon:yes gene_type:complete
VGIPFLDKCLGGALAEEEKKVPQGKKKELSEEELYHRNQVWVGIGATCVLVLAIGLQIWKYNLESDQLRVQQQAEKAEAARAAVQNAFWVKEETKSLKKERDVLLKKIENESRMIQWGLERSTDPTVVEQAKHRRKQHQQKLERINRDLAKLREMQ